LPHAVDHQALVDGLLLLAVALARTRGAAPHGGRLGERRRTAWARPLRSAGTRGCRGRRRYRGAGRAGALGVGGGLLARAIGGGGLAVHLGLVLALAGDLAFDRLFLLVHLLMDAIDDRGVDGAHVA